MIPYVNSNAHMLGTYADMTNPSAPISIPVPVAVWQPKRLIMALIIGPENHNITYADS